MAAPKVFHHSSNDMLCDGHWHDAFSVFCRYEHDGNIKAAVRAAAEKLGIAPEPKAPLAEPRADGSPLCTDMGNSDRFTRQAGKRLPLLRILGQMAGLERRSMETG